MRQVFRVALLAGGAFAVYGCETLPEGALGDIGRDVFGEVAGSASVKMIRDTADSMCSSGDAMCRNVTMTAMSGFTEAFIKQLSQSDVRQINEARDRSIASGEEQTWENPETGASGTVATQPAEQRPPEPTPVKVKRGRLKSLPVMEAVGEPYVVDAAGGVNVRGGPSTDYEVVDRLEDAERIRAIGKVRGEDWYLVGRGSVGIGYVFGDLIAPFTPPEDEPLDEALDVEDEAAGEDVAQANVDMASDCFTTTQTVKLASGATEEATVTSCRTPNGWATV